MNYLRSRRRNKMAKKLECAGLRGKVAGETALCTVGKEEGLAYRVTKIET